MFAPLIMILSTVEPKPKPKPNPNPKNFDNFDSSHEDFIWALKKSLDFDTCNGFLNHISEEKSYLVRNLPRELLELSSIPIFNFFFCFFFFQRTTSGWPFSMLLKSPYPFLAWILLVSFTTRLSSPLIERVFICNLPSFSIAYLLELCGGQLPGFNQWGL